jgi:hypothetical protein
MILISIAPPKTTLIQCMNLQKSITMRAVITIADLLISWTKLNWQEWIRKFASQTNITPDEEKRQKCQEIWAWTIPEQLQCKIQREN